MSDSTRCTAQTKRGTNCKAARLKGKNFCSAHDPEASPSTRFGSRAQASEAGKLGGRPKNPRVVDVLRERFEARADEFLDALEQGLKAEQAYTVGFGEYAHVEMVPDYRTRLKALEVAFDRVYGRPAQAVELTGKDGGPVEHVTLPTDGDWKRDALAAMGDVAGELVGANGNGNGNGHANGNGHH